MRNIGWFFGLVLDVVVMAFMVSVAMKVDFSPWIRSIDIWLKAH